jgi:outer membrane lipoprotein-sorting protein
LLGALLFAPTAFALSAEEVADGVQRFYEKTPALRGHFTQVVKKKGVSKGLKRKGIVYLKKGGGEGKSGGKMRWEYPSEEIFYFGDGEVLWTYERRERLATKLKIKNSRLYQSTSYLMGQGNLKADFKLSLDENHKDDATLALVLTPRSGTQTMKSLTLVVDAKTFELRSSILVDPLGDTTTLHLSGLIYEDLADSVFAWTPPSGVTVKEIQ